MADVVARSTQPALAAIKLAWWRERLQELDEGKVPAEPRLTAAARELLPRGLSGAEVAQLEEGWALLLQPEGQQHAEGVQLRGHTLFTLAARLLDVPMSERLNDAAECFSWADLARRGIIQLPKQQPVRSAVRFPARERPLSALGALARRDLRLGGPPFEAEATPGRAWALLRHRFTGHH